MRKKLILSDGTRDRELQLVDRLVVGRDPACEISHDDSLLSRRHAEFVTTGDTVTVRDLGSRNGVFVNGVRAAAQLLEPGDVVQIGPLRAQFVIDGTSETITPEHLDDDRTAMIRNAFAVVPDVDDRPGTSEDDEVTRMVPAPRMPGPSPAASRPSGTSAVGLIDDHEAPTHFLSGVPAEPVRPDPPSWGAVTTGSAAVPAGSARTEPVVQAGSTAYVFGLLLCVAAVILAAAAVPMLIWRRAAIDGDTASMSFNWLLLPAVVALIATYAAASSINRRIARSSGVDRGRG